MKNKFLIALALFAFACGGAPEDGQLGAAHQAIDVSGGEGFAGWRATNTAERCTGASTEHCFLPGQTPRTGKGTYDLWVGNSAKTSFNVNYGALTADINAINTVVQGSGYNIVRTGCSGGGTDCLDLNIQNGSVFQGTPTNTDQNADSFVRYSCGRSTELTGDTGHGQQSQCQLVIATFDVAKFSTWLVALGVPDNTKQQWIQHMFTQMYSHMAGFGTITTDATLNSNNDAMARSLKHIGNPFNSLAYFESCTMLYTDIAADPGVWVPVDSLFCDG